MDMSVSIKDLESYYSDMDEGRLLRLAKYEFNDLEFPAKEALKSELAKRGLLGGKTLFLINRQEDEPDDIEVKAIAVHVQNQICPHCNKRKMSNAWVLPRRIGLLVFLFKQEELVFGCKDCLLRKLKSRSILSTISLVPSFWLPLIPLFLRSDSRLRRQIKEASDDIPSASLLENIRRNIKTYRDLLF
jgi:hypothetical protein